MSQPYGRSVVGAAGSSAFGMAPSLVTGFDVTVVRGRASGRSAAAERPDPTKWWSWFRGSDAQMPLEGGGWV